MFDLVIRGATVVSGDRQDAAEIAITGEKIAALLPPGAEAEAREELRVDGRFILPGLVDAHAHLREPGLTEKEDFSSGTKAAIAGGVTTILVMPTDDPWTETEEQFRAKQALAAGRIYADIGLQVAVSNRPQALERLAGLGASSFEIFTADVPDEFLHATAQEVLEAAVRVSEAGGVVAISPLDQSILNLANQERSLRAGSIEDFISKFPPESEVSGIARNALVSATGRLPVHIRQISTSAAVGAVRALKERADLTVETSPQLLHFTAKDYEAQGPFLKASPPLRSPGDAEALIQGIADKTIDMVVTDHAPHTRAEKLSFRNDFKAVPGGMPGLQTLLPAMLALVGRKSIGLSDLVRVCAEGPAKRFGLADRKGSLKPGADADLVVLDTSRSTTLHNEEQLSKAGYTVFDGLSVPFRIEHVYLRGQQAFGLNGLAAAPRGHYLAC